MENVQRARTGREREREGESAQAERKHSLLIHMYPVTVMIFRYNMNAEEDTLNLFLELTKNSIDMEIWKKQPIKWILPRGRTLNLFVLISGLLFCFITPPSGEHLWFEVRTICYSVLYTHECNEFNVIEYKYVYFGETSTFSLVPSLGENINCPTLWFIKNMC